MSERVQDERLMAYADGALPPDERSEISALLRADPAMQERVDALREGGELARNALDNALHEPLPEELVALIEGGQPIGTSAPVIPPRTFTVKPTELAIAACLLLAIGAAGGYWLKDGAVPGPGLDPQIAAALTSATSGTAVPLQIDGVSADVLPMLTFIDAKGRYCRQFIHRTSQAGVDAAFEGIACREPGTGWTPVVTVVMDVAAANTDSYQAASGGGQSLIDRYIETNINGVPVTGPKEADLIKRGWPAPETE